MTEQVFLEKLAYTLDAEGELSLDMVLDDLEEWDSLSVVSFIAMANTECGKVLQATDVQEARTVADLYAMVK